MTTIEWVMKQLEKCEMLASMKGWDRNAWLEEARYFRAILMILDERKETCIDENHA
jgi:hypothetical protein